MQPGAPPLPFSSPPKATQPYPRADLYPRPVEQQWSSEMDPAEAPRFHPGKQQQGALNRPSAPRPSHGLDRSQQKYTNDGSRNR